MSFNWLKHYMPRSLYGRAALILLLPIVFLQFVVAVLFITRHFEDVTQQMTTTVAREISLVKDVAEASPDRESIESDVASSLSQLAITARPIAEQNVPEQHMRRWYDFSGTVILAQLPTQLDAIIAIDLSNDRLVRVFVATRHGPIVLEFDRRRISAANPHQLFVNMMFFGGLITAIAVLYLRNQLRPIKRLAIVAEAFGRGRHLPYSPAGAVEVRAAGNAFVDMRNRIERHIEQRTLLLSGVSHDLRTPLTRMRLSLSMMEDDEREALQRDVDDMQKMLDAFLNFAESSTASETERVNPFEMVREVVTKARRAGQEVELSSQNDQNTGAVELNLIAMQRAVDNLISNAVRYGTKAVVSVVLSEKSLRIRVEDDGPGIPKDKREQALRPFSKLDPARNQDQGGSVGLGLAIAADIARAHGGVLRLDCAEELGGLRADIVIAR